MNFGKRKRAASSGRYVRRRTNRPAMSTRRRRTRSFRRRPRKAAIRRSIPDFTMVALPYTEHIQMTSMSLSPANGYKYRLNSLFDFRYAAGGHQPLGFDQYAAFFQKYRVHSTKVKVTWYDPGNMNGQVMKVALYGAPHASNLGVNESFDLLDELPGAKTNVLSVAPGEKWRTSLSAYYKMHRLQGVSKTEYNTDVTYEAFNTTNPGSSPILYILAWDPNGASAATVWFEIKATMYASVFRKNPLGQS